jgi:histidinol dehydrogenase
MALQNLTSEQLAALGTPAEAAAQLRALAPDGAAVEDAVREITRRVRDGGDAAVLDCTRALDTGGAEPRPLLVEPEQLDDAIRQLPLDVVAGLQVAIANVANVAQAGVSEDTAVTLPQGQRIVLRELPVDSAAVYVPGGRAPYPSTVVMGVVTARAAGVLDVAVCSPPGPDGEIATAILGTCRLCGVQRVYRMGGAQAIAALAYGTETVDRVDVVVGPGNLYVQEAKRQLSAVVGIDGFAGPSDLLLILGADAAARDASLAALDLLAQAEHGAGSTVVALAVGPEQAQGLRESLARLEAERTLEAEGVPEAEGVLEAASVALVEVADAEQALALANEFAPEHLQLIGPDAEARARSVRAAGCVFVGACSATAFGDYVAGSNHVLPTGGAARFSSALSPRHFRRRMAEVHIGSEAADKLALAGAPIARGEGFEWHARSMEARMVDNSRS